ISCISCGFPDMRWGEKSSAGVPGGKRKRSGATASSEVPSPRAQTSRPFLTSTARVASVSGLKYKPANLESCEALSWIVGEAVGLDAVVDARGGRKMSASLLDIVYASM